jgi:hypothetical protein
MRLLNAATIKFQEFDGAFIPAYAMLSHRWEDEEVSYQELKVDAPVTRSKKGFKKIQQCCEQALQDGLSFVWVGKIVPDLAMSATS